ncbi:MAG: amidohydrolase family protein [Gemmatimonadales bacterium]
MRADWRSGGRAGGLLLAGVALLLAGATRLEAQAIAITGGTVYPVSGPKIENATVLIENGRITAVGANVAVPAGARRVDARGKWVTPGFIHSSTTLGLATVGSVSETNESRMEGDVDAAFNVAEGINPATVNIPVARIEGVTTALTRPGGGLIAGQAVLVDLAGDRIEDMLVKSPAAMVIDFSARSKSAGGGSRAGALQRLRQLFLDAREYDRRKGDFQKAQMQELSASAADLEALLPVLRGAVPVYGIADQRSDIESALRIMREFKLRLVLWGGREAWQIGPELAAAGVPVITYPLENIPDFNGLGARSDNATLLRQAGVTVLLAEGESGGPRDLRFAAGHAIRNGLSWDDALLAVTLAPARAFGIADRYGSLEPGKVADVVLWSGDPFEFSSKPDLVLIRGNEIPLRSRQTELLERYRALPPEY